MLNPRKSRVYFSVTILSEVVIWRLKNTESIGQSPKVGRKLSATELRHSAGLSSAKLETDQNNFPNILPSLGPNPYPPPMSG